MEYDSEAEEYLPQKPEMLSSISLDMQEVHDLLSSDFRDMAAINADMESQPAGAASSNIAMEELASLMPNKPADSQYSFDIDLLDITSNGREVAAAAEAQREAEQYALLIA